MFFFVATQVQIFLACDYKVILFLKKNYTIKSGKYRAESNFLLLLLLVLFLFHFYIFFSFCPSMECSL